MNKNEKICLIQENRQLQQKLNKISSQNMDILSIANFLDKLLGTKDLEKITYMIIEHMNELFEGKAARFIRKEPKKDTYACYQMKNGNIKKTLLHRNHLGKDFFFMYCNRFYICNSNKDTSFIAIPIKYEGENIGLITIKEFNNEKLENKNTKLMEVYSLILGVVIKNCLLIGQRQIEKKIILEQNRKISEDLKYAKKTQEYLLPKGRHDFGKYNIYCNHIQIQCLGGDLYDVVKYNDNKIIFYIADISGHGISASLLTLFLKQSVIGISKSFNDDLISPSEILEKLYKRFNDFMVDTELYIGILIGVLDIKKDKVTIANGGHNVEPIHIKTNERQVISYNIEGLPINSWFKELKFTYQDKSIFLNKDDKLIFLTDGATEVMLNENEILGTQRIEKVFYQNMNLNCDKQFDEMMKYINSYSEEASIKDDIAFVCLNRIN